MADLVDVAISQIGVNADNNGHMKYINWYGGFGNGTAWCAIFVSWCANQAGISTSVIPKYAAVSDGMAWYKKKGLFQSKGSYKPKRGDLVFFKNNRSHTGIVEKTVGSTFYTIEGNAKDQVARRNYSLSESTLTGFGTPNYGSNTYSPNQIKQSKQEQEKEEPFDPSKAPTLTADQVIGGKVSNSGNSNRSKELDYLKHYLEKLEKPRIVKSVQGEIRPSKETIRPDIQVLVDNGKNLFYIPVLEGMSLTVERKGSPGKLCFKTPYHKQYDIKEGNNVTLIINGKKLFFGFIFTKKQDRDLILDVTAYDQIRYLKNKDYLVYENKTAKELIQMIAQNYHLRVGKLMDTKYKLSKIEDNVTLLDMIQNALDETMMNTDKLYVLYDEVGALTLKDMSSMVCNQCMIAIDTTENYSYQSTIDSGVYNQVKLRYDNKDKKNTDFFDQDINSINKWGILQLYEKINNPDIGDVKVKLLLKKYNKEVKTLSVTGVIGHRLVRAGSYVPVFFDSGEVKIQNYLLVEKVTHKFNSKEHKMDLVLSGGGFYE